MAGAEIVKAISLRVKKILKKPHSGLKVCYTKNQEEASQNGVLVFETT
jgi:hypothetical protein